MARSAGTRRGTGAGWGGPAKGGSPTPTRSAFEAGNTIAVGHGHPTATVHEQNQARDAERAQALKDHLFTLATSAERQDTQVRAAEAWLNRQEGMPVARNVNLNLNEVSRLTDADLDAEISRLAPGAGDTGSDVAGEASSGLPAGSGDLVH